METGGSSSSFGGSPCLRPVKPKPQGTPVSVRTRLQGAAQAFRSSLTDTLLLILAAIITMYIVLGVLYESYIHPVTILSTLPSAGIGALLGLKVIAGASTAEKRQLGLDRGAFASVDVINDDVKAKVREISGGVDIVYDPVGGDLAEPCLRALKANGQYMVVGFVAGIPRLPANFVLLTNRTVVGVDWGAWVGQNQAENQAMLREVMQNIVAGKLHPVEPVSYPMSRAVDAMRDLQNRKVAGKVALVPDFD